MSKLLCVIIDGLHAETLACAHVPCFDSLARGGVLSRQLQPSHPSLTIPTLVSLLTSLPAEEHGVWSNSGISQVSPHAVSLFSLLRYRHQNSAAFYSNDRLRLLFPPGSLQTGMLINSQSIRNVDRELTEQAARHLQREKPDCCLLYLEGADIAGVHFGFTSEPYLESVEQADRSLGLLLEHLTVVGLQQDYVTMVMGCYGGAGPRIEAQSEFCLPLLLSGPGIRKGEEIKHPLSLLDVTPTKAGILGLAPHPDWRGRVLAEAFLRQPLELKTLGRSKGTKPRKRQDWGGISQGEAGCKQILFKE
jgi:predicted AlkP superfamily pyrophosphatase or phosphodiesterase